MSSLVLKEIGASNPEDQSVLELFASFREHVVHVSATHLLPDQIAVTTKNGFVELIDTASGEFRLFLTYLERIPLDASLRCFSLVPSLHAASAKHHLHLMYSLAYSNELLLANVETGTVQVLATCVSRPSVVQCDGDYIVCGEGNGRVSVWRGSAEARDRVHVRGGVGGGATLPPLLWQHGFFDDTVVCFGLHRSQLLCCTADYRCLVVGVEDGCIRASLSLPDFQRGVAAFALTTPPPSLLVGRHVMAVCLTSRIAIFTEPPLSGRGADAAAARPSTAVSSSATVTLRQWTYRGGCAIGEAEEITCASCLGAYLAAGTRAGLVLLFTCDAAAQQVKEMVRFNVGYGVKGAQLFTDDTLLVVTSAGDVWRWPLSDLLSTARESAGAAERATQLTDPEEEEEEPVPAADTPPRPAAAPGLRTAAYPVQANATPCEVSYTQEGEAEERNLSVHDASTVAPNSPCKETAGAEADKPPAAAASRSETATPLVGRSNDAEGGTATSVHRSSLHGGDDADLTVYTDDEDRHSVPHEENSLGTDRQPTEPATTLSFSGQALSESMPECRRAKITVEEVKSFAQDKPQATLYDPEYNATATDTASPEAHKQENDEVVADASAFPGMQSEEASQSDSVTAVSPPSSAETTAHIEASAEGASERSGSSRGLVSPVKRADERTDASCGQEITSSGDIRHPPSVNVAGNDGGNKAARKSASAHVAAPPKPNTTTKDAEEMAQLEAEFDQAVTRMLGPKASIKGLQRGRRMDPRKVVGILQNLANQRASTTDGTAGTSSADTPPPALAGLNSTKLLEEQRAAVGAAVFDFEAYRQAHRLEVDALQYQHPVKALTYALRDRVFGGVEAVARIRDAGGNTEEDSAQETRGVAAPLASSQDELRDVTYGRVKRVVDPAIVEERRRGGPELRQHRCDDLLFPSPPVQSAVLFHEDAPLPSTVWEEVLLLPMPLPPASSVF